MDRFFRIFKNKNLVENNHEENHLIDGSKVTNHQQNLKKKETDWG